MRSYIQMKSTARVGELLTTLEENRSHYTKCLREAQDGYRKKAIEILQARAQELEKGKNVSLQFRAVPPKDHTECYDTAIQMLQWTKRAGQEQITLDAEEFRSLVLNEWDWSEGFFSVAKLYSVSSSEYAEMKGW